MIALALIEFSGDCPCPVCGAGMAHQPAHAAWCDGTRVWLRSEPETS